MLGLHIPSDEEIQRLISATAIPAAVIAELVDEAVSRAFELFDMAVKRMTPTSANVTISLGNLPYCQAAEVYLTKSQGRAVTQPHVSELGGLKHWRQLSTAEDRILTPQRIEEGKALSRALGGYRVHIAEEAVDGLIPDEDCHRDQIRPFIL
ncbi:hypothetical protein V2G26_004892 [Clonostachys chloroleuca]